MTEAFAIGLLGSALGLLAGIGFSSVLETLFRALEIDLPATGTVVAARTVIVSLVLGTTITVISALFPALRATRVPPVAGLREGAVLSTPRQHRIRAGIGTVLALLGIALMALGLFGIADPGELALGAGAVVVFIGVALLSPWLVPPLAALVGKPLERLRGTPGRIAHENTVRNPGRTAATASALMIGLALVSFVAIFAAGLKGSIDDAIDETITADLYLANSDGFSDIPAGAADTVGGIEGVELAAPLRYTQYAKPDGSKGGFLTLLGTEGAADVLELDWRDGGSDELLTEMGPNDAVLDEGFADDKGLETGETFSVLTASGERIDYTVTGTFKDKTDFIGDYAASDANAGAYGEGDNATNVLVRLGDGVDTDAVRGQIEETVEQGFPTVEVAEPAGAEGLDRRAAQPAARRCLRPALPGGDRLAVRHRQHAGALDPRAHARARAAARRRHLAAPGAAHRPLRGRDHGADRRGPGGGARGDLRRAHQPPARRGGVHAHDPRRDPAGAARPRRARGRARRDRAGPPRLAPRRAPGALLRVARRSLSSPHVRVAAPHPRRAKPEEMRDGARPPGESAQRNSVHLDKSRSAPRGYAASRVTRVTQPLFGAVPDRARRRAISGG